MIYFLYAKRTVFYIVRFGWVINFTGNHEGALASWSLCCWCHMFPSKPVAICGIVTERRDLDAHQNEFCAEISSVQFSNCVVLALLEIGRPPFRFPERWALHRISPIGAFTKGIDAWNRGFAVVVDDYAPAMRTFDTRRP